jgi:ABC-type Na+ efflux pump permease subunit
MKLRKTLRIAKWEVEHQYTNIGIKRILIFALITILTLSLFTFAGTNAVLQDRLYSIGVSSDSPYASVVEDTPEFNAVTLEPDSERLSRENVVNGRFDLVIVDENIYKSSDRESDVALDTLKQSIIETNQQRLVDSGYDNIAFPVLANLTYMEQSSVNSILDQQTREDLNDMNSDEIQETNNTDQNTEGSSEQKEQSTQDETSNNGAGNNGAGNNEAGNNEAGNTEGTNRPDDSAQDEPDNLNVVETDGDSNLTTPSGIQPPFPLKSIIVGFIFLVPMNFIVQTYASSFFDETINYSGELLLVTPISRFDIIVGKTIPYLLLILGIATLLAVVFGTTILSVLAIGAIGIAFLSAGFITGIFARSYRELTFVFLSLSLGIFGFVLVPSVFTTIHPISIISPLTVVVSELESEALNLGDLVFSMGPLTLTGILLYLYGSGIYKEEDLFTERRVPRKFLDALSNWIDSPKSLLLVGITVIPFVFASQLLLVALLFALPEALALPVLLLLAAFIEEFAKSVPIYAGVIDEKLVGRKEKYLAAVLSGAGFFVGEQITTIVQLVGLLKIDVGSAVFSGTLDQVSTSDPLIFLLPIMWIAIHPISTVISSVGSGRGRYAYIITIILGTAVHLAYNLLVITNV